MRNRYKRDINRIVVHPKARREARSLRNPGGIEPVYSQSLGLARTAETNAVPSGVAFRPSRVDFSSANWPLLGAVRTNYGAPYEIGGSEINWPLGTESGESSWVATPLNGALNIARGMDTAYGSANWIGNDGSVLSWDAPPGRVFEHILGGRGIEWFQFDLKNRWRLGQGLYYQGRNLGSALSPSSITGAAFWRDGSGNEWLRYFNRNILLQIPVDGSRNPVGEPTEVARFNAPSSYDAITGWYFSSSGDRAVCTFIELYDNPNWPASSPYDKLQRRIVARFNGGSINESIVYDQGTLVGTDVANRWSDVTVTERYPDNPALDFVEFQIVENSTRNVDAYSVPLYFDFDGDQEISVNLNIGSQEYTSQYQRTGKWDGLESSESNSENYSIEFIGEPDQLVRSDGTVIATLPAQSRTVIESGSYSRESTNATATATTYEKNHAVSYRILAVDGRFNCCALLLLQQDGQFSGSGEPYPHIDSYHISGSGNYSYRDSINLYVAGEQKDSVLAYEQLYAWTQRPNYIKTINMEGRPSNKDEVTVSRDLEGRLVAMEQRYIVDFIGYEASGAGFYSATLLPPGSQVQDGRRLLFIKGGPSIIDAALATGDDLYFLNPGLR